MNNKHQRIQTTEIPAGADNLQTIDGIGPGIQSRLYGANILTYAQLADLSPNEIAPLVAGIAGMSVDRIIKQDWIGQARKLAPAGGLGSQEAAASDQDLIKLAEEPLSQSSHQPYATFTVELLLDDDNNVRRTRVKHVQGSAEDSWAGWHPSRLTDSLVRQGSLRVPSENPVVLADPMERAVEVDQQAEEAVVALAEPAEVVAPAEEAIAVLAESAEELGRAETIEESVPAPTAGPTATLRLYDLGVSSGSAKTARHMLRAGQPFMVELSCGIADATLPVDLPSRYVATLSAKKMGDGQRLTLGEESGTLLAKDSATIMVNCGSLERGIYRMEAAVTLQLPESLGAVPRNLSAFIEGQLIQVY